jgi:DNA-binding transcriptional ArsR family regulator
VSADHVDADPRILRGIAHPLRTALLYELHARGRANVTTLAGAVGKPVNAVSFHLRQLAKYGLIEPADGDDGDGRQRWWRPAARQGLRLEDDVLSRSPAGREAYEVFRRHGRAFWHAMVDRFFGRHDGGDELWTLHDVPMRLTKAEAEELTSEVYQVLKRWSERGQSGGGAERKTYLALAMLMPHQTDLAADRHR